LKVLFDTNIVLDVLLDRKQFVELSASLVSLVETKDIEGYLCATTLTTIDYLITKTHNRKIAKASVQKLLTIFKIAKVDREVLSLSVESKFTDFEDAVQYYSGKKAEVDSLVTRNINDYKKPNYPIYSPDELWGIIKLNQ